MPPKKGKGKKLSKKKQQQLAEEERRRQEEEQARLEEEAREEASTLLQLYCRGYIGRKIAKEQARVRAEEAALVPTFEWVEPEQNGNVPSRLNRTTGCHVSVTNFCYVTGGVSGANEAHHHPAARQRGRQPLIIEHVQTSLYCLELDTWDWKVIKGGGTAPNVSTGHSLVAYGHYLYQYGGVAQNSTHPMDEIHVFDTEMQTWDIVTPKGDAPPARAEHTASVIGSYMWVFGGNPYLNDLCKLDLVSEEWYIVDAKGELPEGRANHTACVVSDGLYIFGGRNAQKQCLSGMYRFDLGTSEWAPVPFKGTGPAPREGHAMIVQGNNIIIYGGHDGPNVWADAWSLSLDTMKWSVLFEEAPTLGEHSQVVIDGRVILLSNSERGNIWKPYILESFGKKATGKPHKMMTPKVESRLSCSGFVQISWTPPPQGVIKMKVEMRDMSQDAWKMCYEGDEHSIELNNLIGEDGYQFRVSAYNQKGWGPTSEPLFVKRIIVPGIPDVLRLVVEQVTSTSVKLHWSEPRQLVDKYRLEIREMLNAQPPWNTAYEGSTRTCTVEHLFNNSIYHFRVSAHNDDGWGAFSEISEVLTQQQVAWQPKMGGTDSFHRPWMINIQS
eukprot:GFYU01007573.1.p1 GENE.GFYU01007573.1~~GFYU01007573.1.p1  ORF type:complete len:611 (+),score=152.27 GFYU01007573.1:197-2029(+)